MSLLTVQTSPLLQVSNGAHSNGHAGPRLEGTTHHPEGGASTSSTPSHSSNGAARSSRGMAVELQDVHFGYSGAELFSLLNLRQTLCPSLRIQLLAAERILLCNRMPQPLLSHARSVLQRTGWCCEACRSAYQQAPRAPSWAPQAAASPRCCGC